MPTQKPLPSLQERFSELQKRHKAIIDNIGVGVALISPAMRILSLNRQMRQWFPEVNASICPVCYRSFNRPARTRPCFYCPCVKTLKDGKVHESVTETPRPGGTVNFRIISSPIKNAKEQVVAVIEMVEDITARIRSEEQLRRHQHMLAQSTAQIREFSRKLLSVRDEERKKLSSELHDEVGACALSVNSSLTIAEEEARSGNTPAALRLIDAAKQSVKTTSENLKKLAVGLMPPDIEMAGLVSALATMVVRLSREARINISFNGRPLGRALSADMSLGLYRITQEALNNVIRHSKAHRAWVVLRRDKKAGGLQLSVKDNGRGFDPAVFESGRGGIGIQAMKERAASLRGSFSLVSRPGRGTTIKVKVPIWTNP